MVGAEGRAVSVSFTEKGSPGLSSLPSEVSHLTLLGTSGRGPSQEEPGCNWLVPLCPTPLSLPASDSWNV